MANIWHIYARNGGIWRWVHHGGVRGHPHMLWKCPLLFCTACLEGERHSLPPIKCIHGIMVWAVSFVLSLQLHLVSNRLQVMHTHWLALAALHTWCEVLLACRWHILAWSQCSWTSGACIYLIPYMVLVYRKTVEHQQVRTQDIQNVFVSWTNICMDMHGWRVNWLKYVLRFELPSVPCKASGLARWLWKGFWLHTDVTVATLCGHIGEFSAKPWNQAACMLFFQCAAGGGWDGQNI